MGVDLEVTGLYIFPLIKSDGKNPGPGSVL